jgi:3-dehydroquinate dehydratase-2
MRRARASRLPLYTRGPYKADAAWVTASDRPWRKPFTSSTAPNLNLLGKREPKIYGRATLRDVEKLCRQAAARHKLEVEFRQSNHEGEIVDSIHEAAAKKAAGIVINPGAYTHTSVAIRDAVAATDVPVVEVHISNIFARESFRHHSHVAAVAKASLCGFGDRRLCACNRGAGRADRRARKRAEGMAGERKSKDTQGQSAVDHALIRELAQLLDETGLTEIEFERDGQRVRVARQAQAVVAAPLRAPVDGPCPFPSPRRSIPPSIRAWSLRPWSAPPMSGPSRARGPSSRSAAGWRRATRSLSSKP